MTTRHRIETFAVLIIGASSLAGCLRGAEARRAEASAAPAASLTTGRVRAAAAPEPATWADPSTAAPAPQLVLATQEFNTNPDLRCDVLEVKRVSGGALLVKWRVSRTPAAGASGTIAPAPAQPIYHNWSWEGVYFTDATENKKYLGLRDSSGAWLAQGRDQHFGPGDRQIMWMKFPAPPETSARITFVFPGFAPFEDLPVGR